MTFALAGGKKAEFPKGSAAHGVFHGADFEAVGLRRR
jgi:hypothetical protein